MTARIGRRTFAVGVVALAATVMAGCSEPTDGGGGDGGSTQLTLYTSEPQAKIDEVVKAFHEANPDTEVKVFRAGTGDLSARIDSEHKTGKVAADVLLAADVPTFGKYKKQDLLQKYSPVEADKLEKFAVDPDGYYVGTRLIPTVIAYNTQRVAKPPTSWKELADPRYDQQIVLPNPAVSGAAAFNASAWMADQRLGGEWIDALGRTKPLVAESNGPASQKVADGSRPVGIVVDYLVRDLAAKGSPVSVSYPTEGVPYVTQPGAILKDSTHPEQAKKFLDFIVSLDGQKLAVKQNYLPVRADAGTPQGTPGLDELELLPQDLAAISAGQKDAVARFTAAVGA